MATAQFITPFYTSQLYNITISNQALLTNVTNGRYFIVFNTDATTSIGLLEFGVFGIKLIPIFRTECIAFNVDDAIIEIRLNGVTYYLELSGTTVYIRTSSGTSNIILLIISLINGMSISNKIKLDQIQEVTSSNGTLFSTELKTTGIRHTVTTITNDTTLVNTHDFILCNTSAPKNITLPLATSCPGKEYTIVNKTSNAITINTSGGEFIDNGSDTSILLNIQYSKVKLYNDGVMWFTV